MGTEYALLCDKTHEAFNLGVGRWYIWQQEGLPGDVAGAYALLNGWLDNVAWKPPQGREEWIGETANKIWDFVETHPGCRVVSDTDPAPFYWDKEPDEHPETPGLVFYREVGSRYNEDGT